MQPQSVQESNTPVSSPQPPPSVTHDTEMADADVDLDETEPEPTPKKTPRRKPAKRRRTTKTTEAATATPRLPPTFGEIAEQNNAATKGNARSPNGASPAPAAATGRSRGANSARRRRVSAAAVKDDPDDSVVVSVPAAVEEPKVESEPESSDSEGSCAISIRGEDEEPPITVCLWQADESEPPCGEDLQATDRLVQHLMEAHLGQRRSKYTCEWQECVRKGILQTSRFALVAHLRSHTGEKPFLCQLPECDRSFTRTDALAKHMRTAHDVELVRPESTRYANQDKDELADEYVPIPPPEHFAAAAADQSVKVLMSGDLNVQAILLEFDLRTVDAMNARDDRKIAKRRRQKALAAGKDDGAAESDAESLGESEPEEKLPDDLEELWQVLKVKYKWAVDRAIELDKAFKAAERELERERRLKERWLTEEIHKQLDGDGQAGSFLYH